MKRFLFLLGMLAACAPAAADHEKLGDAAVAQGNYDDALLEFRAAVQSSPRPRVFAKLAEAALHTRDYRTGADGFRRLAEADPTRAGEAATGLEMVAEGAARTGDATALEAAVLALQALAPDRPIGRLALPLVLQGTLAPDRELALLPDALAAAGDGGTVDSLLILYAGAYRRTTACEDAVRIYSILQRRTGSLPASALPGYSACSFQLGSDAQTLNQPENAERWFGLVLRLDSTSTLGRRALVGYADARAAQGDTAAAVHALQEAAGGQDSIAQRALGRLQTLGMSLPGDSLTPQP